jgi:hypothetical protein
MRRKTESNDSQRTAALFSEKHCIEIFRLNRDRFGGDSRVIQCTHSFIIPSICMIYKDHLVSLKLLDRSFWRFGSLDSPDSLECSCFIQ